MAQIDAESRKDLERDVQQYLRGNIPLEHVVERVVLLYGERKISGDTGMEMLSNVLAFTSAMV
jgi:hypothetical protein